MNFDNPAEDIERLHNEAEELAERAKYVTSDAQADALRHEANAKVREASMIRLQIGG